MNVVFRADASIQIGTGHVMRCLALADAITQKGGSCTFICREHPGNLIQLVLGRGHQVYPLSVPLESTTSKSSDVDAVTHAAWLGNTQEKDAVEVSIILAKIRPTWLIVDHYAIDARWEKCVRPYTSRLMVIDDLSDRNHYCDLLLDQTFGRDPKDYYEQVPAFCQLLCGSEYALLRPEFLEWQKYSHERRQGCKVEHLLINLGGADKYNVTARVLRALKICDLPSHLAITVIMGAAAPWVESVRYEASNMRWPTRVEVGVENMAELMAYSDIAVGAAGSTAWERCVLGLPSLMLILSENQRYIARVLDDCGAAISLNVDNLERELDASLQKLILNKHTLFHRAIELVDGRGCERIRHHIYELLK